MHFGAAHATAKVPGVRTLPLLREVHDRLKGGQALTAGKVAA